MRRVLLSPLFLVVCSAASAAPIGLEQVIESVEKRYPVLQGARIDIDAAQGELTAAEGSFDLLWKNRLTTNPIGYYDNLRYDSVLEKPLGPWGANVFTGYRRGTGVFPVYDEKALTLSRGEMRVGFDVSLWRNRSIDRRRSNVTKAQLGRTIAEAAAAQARIEAVRAAANRYWDWVAAGKRVAVFRNLLSIAEERDEALLERVKHGDLPDFERKDNERAILQRRSQLVAAERSAQQAAIELSLFFRSSEGDPRIATEEELPTEIPLIATIPAVAISEDIDQAIRQRPELSRLAATKAQFLVEEQWADNQLAPRVEIQVAASKDMGNGSETRRYTELEAGLLVEIPVERNLATGRRQSARAAHERVEASERMMRDRIEADVRDAHSLLRAASQRGAIAVAETALARKLEEGERVRFEHGDSNLLFVNLREQATADALVREVEARADFQKGLAQRNAAVGEP